MPAVPDSAFTPLVLPRVGETPLDIRSETDRARVRGYADGFAEGRRVALDDARAQQTLDQERLRLREAADAQERGAALAALHAAREALDARTARLGELAAIRIEELAIQLAATILGAELSDPARSAAHALRRAIDEVPAGRWVRVAFSEDDHRTLTTGAGAVLGLSGIETVASADVDAGGAIVEIEDGAVDTRIGEALRRAAEALHGGDSQDGESG